LCEPEFTNTGVNTMMAYESERRTILQMINEGKITAQDGARLLEALGGSSRADRPVSPAPSPVSEPPSPESSQVTFLPEGEATISDEKPRWFRVRVTDMVTGRVKVTVTLAFALVRWGLNVGAQYIPERQDFNMQGFAMHDFNLKELADILEQGYKGKLVDVQDEEDGEHVEIFVD